MSVKLVTFGPAVQVE